MYSSEKLHKLTSKTQKDKSSSNESVDVRYCLCSEFVSYNCVIKGRVSELFHSQHRVHYGMPVKKSQITFICIELFTIEIVSKHLHIKKTGE